MATIDELRARAELIAEETQIGGNTAERVGEAFDMVADIIEAVDPEENQAVLYNEQSPTTAQQAQARTNIDAQQTLTSGSNIKTVAGHSLLGSGDVELDNVEVTQSASAQTTTISVNDTDYAIAVGAAPVDDSVKYTAPTWQAVNTALADKVNYTDLQTSVSASSSLPVQSQAIASAIAASANVQADWDTTSASDGSYIKNKPNIVENLAGSASESTTLIKAGNNSTNGAYVRVDQSTAAISGNGGGVAISSNGVELTAGNSGYPNATVMYNGYEIAKKTEVNAVASAKANKASNPTSGDLAALDSSGNVTDSGYKPADFQTALTFDDYPTDSSSNPVKSGGVYTMLTTKQDKMFLESISGGGVLRAGLNYYHKMTSTVDTLNIILPVPSSIIYVNHTIIEFTTGTTPNITFTSTATVTTSLTFEANTHYLIECYYSVDEWIVDSVDAREKVDNKVTAISSSSTDVEYPSAKAVYDELADKQDTISDLATIRSGASAGATAYQKPSGGIPASDLASAVQTSLTAADNAAPQSTTYTKTETNTLLAAKQGTLTFDSTPTNGSTNPVTSGGVYSALATKADTSTTYTKTEVDNLIVPANTTISVVSALPSSGSANTIYRVAGTNSYSDYGWDGSQFVLLATYTNSLYPQIGYYTCDSAASDRIKVVTASGYTLIAGSCLKIKFTYATTYSDNNWPTLLNINSTGSKGLYYNGTRANLDNTWAAGDVVTVFYDGTAYWAYSLPQNGIGQPLSSKTYGKNIPCAVEIMGGLFESRNLFNKYDENILTGYYIASSSGRYYTNASYNVTGWIPITEGESYIGASTSHTCFFDGDFQYISGAASLSTATTAPQNAKYMRVSYYGVNTDKVMINKGSTLYSVADFKPYLKSTFGVNIPWEELPTSIVSPTKMSFLNGNLYNPNDSDIVEGYVLANANGEMTENDNYLVTGYIPFSQYDDKLVASVNGVAMESPGGYLVLYDADKNPITGFQENTVDSVATWQEDVAYVRFSISPRTADICITKGQRPAPYTPYGQYDLDDSVVVPDSKFVSSMMGQSASTATADSLATGGSLELENFPYFIKKNQSLSVEAGVTTFNAIVVGKGYEQYRGLWAEIDATNIVLKYQSNDNTTTTLTTQPHGLTISTFIKVVMSSDNAGNLYILLQTLGGMFTYTYSDFDFEWNYAPFVLSDGSTFTNVKLNATNADFRCPVWAFGDSYFGVNNSRWVGVMKEIGFFNFMVDGLAGISSAPAFAELNRALAFGTPKWLIWCLGCNDVGNPETAILYAEYVVTLCESKGITPILYTMPNLPERDYDTLNTWVRASGCRYIDFDKAVGSPTYEEGVDNWYDGYLSSDNVHPSPLGAQALATQVLIDFPELMQFGRSSSSTTNTDDGNDH